MFNRGLVANVQNVLVNIRKFTFRKAVQSDKYAATGLPIAFTAVGPTTKGIRVRPMVVLAVGLMAVPVDSALLATLYTRFDVELPAQMTRRSSSDSSPSAPQCRQEKTQERSSSMASGSTRQGFQSYCVAPSTPQDMFAMMMASMQHMAGQWGQQGFMSPSMQHTAGQEAEHETLNTPSPHGSTASGAPTPADTGGLDRSSLPNFLFQTPPGCQAFSREQLLGMHGGSGIDNQDNQRQPKTTMTTKTPTPQTYSGGAAASGVKAGKAAKRAIKPTGPGVGSAAGTKTGQKRRTPEVVEDANWKHTEADFEVGQFVLVEGVYDADKDGNIAPPDPYWVGKIRRIMGADRTLAVSWWHSSMNTSGSHRWHKGHWAFESVHRQPVSWDAVLSKTSFQMRVTGNILSLDVSGKTFTSKKRYRLDKKDLQECVPGFDEVPAPAPSPAVGKSTPPLRDYVCNPQQLLRDSVDHALVPAPALPMAQPMINRLEKAGDAHQQETQVAGYCPIPGCKTAVPETLHKCRACHIPVHNLCVQRLFGANASHDEIEGKFWCHRCAVAGKVTSPFVTLTTVDIEKQLIGGHT